MLCSRGVLARRAAARALGRGALGCFHRRVGQHAGRARGAHAAVRPAGARSHARAQALRCLHATGAHDSYALVHNRIKLTEGRARGLCAATQLANRQRPRQHTGTTLAKWHRSSQFN